MIPGTLTLYAGEKQIDFIHSTSKRVMVEQIEAWKIDHPAATHVLFVPDDMKRDRPRSEYNGQSITNYLKSNPHS